jgi:dipeptidyl-peptidase-4
VITFVKPDTAGVTHLMSLDLERNQQTVLLDGSKLYAAEVNRLIAIQDYAFSADRSRLLIYTDSAPVWRLPTKGYYYVYDFAGQKLTPISSREKGYQMFAKLSANARHVAFVRDRNLFAVELASMKETQLTFDGSEGKIINGTTDWVYEEEFGLRDGWAWSPDGRYIAFLQLDESKTSDFVMADLQGERPALKRFRFPQAGEANSEIRVGVIDINTGRLQYFDTGNWQTDNEAYEYIPRLGWTPAINGKYFVWMLRMNREQNHVALLHGDPENTQLKTVFEDQENTWSSRSIRLAAIPSSFILKTASTCSIKASAMATIIYIFTKPRAGRPGKSRTALGKFPRFMAMIRRANSFILPPTRKAPSSNSCITSLSIRTNPPSLPPRR